MSKNKLSKFRQDRRQWLKTSATAIGATLLPLPALSHEARPDQTKSKPDEQQSVAPFFTPAERAQIEELTETIIPADARSGGAKAAHVAEYIEQMVGESVNEEQKALWKEGLRLVDQLSQHRNGKSFVESSPEQRIAVLTVLSDNEQMTELPEIRFFHELKRLTVAGYYTSKIGIHDELQYKGNKLLLEFVGCDEPSPS